MNRTLIALMSLVLAVAIAVPATAGQFGVGLHYLRTLDDQGFDDFDQNDFGIFGTLTFPIAIVRVEGMLEWVPDYFDEQLIEPSAYGLLDIGPIYGGVGIGIGYLTGDGAGWATNPFYALRAGIDVGLVGFGVDVFATYRFQSANYVDNVQNLDLDKFTLAAQIKFGG
jgi:hypothetical protein